MILYMILSTHAMIIIWFLIESEVKWLHSSFAALTTSSSIAGDNDAIMSSSISIEQALVNHANSSIPTRAALPTILAERNNLSSQSLQLWNHLRKQRRSYSLASNDVKRSRAERDHLRAKLETFTKGKEVSNDKNLNVSTSASSGPEHNLDEANCDASNDVSMTPNEPSSSARAQPTHQHSEGDSGMHFVPEIHTAG